MLYGLSAGGMLAYQVAATNKNVKGVVGMTCLDQRMQEVREGRGREEREHITSGEFPLLTSLPSLLPSLLSFPLHRSVILLRMTWPGPVWECPLPVCLRTRRLEG